jgi:2-phospho-L-lactate transferase/gluconeogenesis factor (CofD/UPF0052 family)
MLNVVVLNGGRGAATLINALLTRQGLHVTSIVNAYDDGKSTGEIRRYFGMLGPSDIRKVQELMLPEDDPDYKSNRRLFAHRFPLDCTAEKVVAGLRAFADRKVDQIDGIAFESELVRASLRSLVMEFLAGVEIAERVIGRPFSFADAALMNCVYAGAFLKFGRDIEQATLFIDRLFKLRGIVLPTNTEDKVLLALRENGRMLYSEAEIVELRSNVRIERLYLLDRYVDRERFELLTIAEKRRYLEHHHCAVRLSGGAESALRQADVIIYSAGTQHSSLYPTYMTGGLARTIAYNKMAFKAFVTNIGADYETPNYTASDYVLGAHRYLTLSEPRQIPMEELFDLILVNRSNLKPDETYVQFDESGFADIPVARCVGTFESLAAPGRHDGGKLAQTILESYEHARAVDLTRDALAMVARRPAGAELHA